MEAAIKNKLCRYLDAGRTNQSTNLSRDQLHHLYWEKQLSTTQIGELLGLTSTGVRNWLVRLGIPRRTDSEANKIWASRRSELDLRIRAQKVRATWYSKSEEDRAAINKTRATKPENKQAAKLKRLETIQRTGGTKSKAEDQFYNQLLISFEVADIVRGYSDSRYPFSCDFYIKSKDLFIEYQGHPTHGPEPYDSSNSKHLELLISMREHHLSTDTWTQRGPLKIQTALKNNITLFLVYPHHTHYKVANGEMVASQISELW